MQQFASQRNNLANEPGHWILARAGKKVLRPGGRQLTAKLIDALQISAQDHVIEIAPGLGFTAAMALSHRPATYTGIDADSKAISHLRKKFGKQKTNFVHADALASGLPAQSATRVYGEAMLTMQTDRKKTEIIREAHRLLKKGGLYAIHELGLAPEDIPEAEKSEVQKELSRAIKVNARPLTVTEWSVLLTENGFRVKEIVVGSMRLLEMRRMVTDEGFFRTLRIAFNILRNPAITKRVLDMRAVFGRYRSKMNAVMLVAEKV
mgnify:CR=1 FL=1